MSDEILKELDSKVYYTITKNWNNRKRAEISAVHKEVKKTSLVSRILLPKIIYKIELVNY